MHRHMKSIISNEAFHDLVADMVVKEAEWMDEARAERAWEIFVKRADVHERRFREWMNDVFARQEAQVIANINANSDPELRGSPVRGLITKDIIDVWLFPSDEWVDDMKSIGGLYMTDAMAETGQAALDNLILDASFNVADPRAEAFIRNRSFKFATDVNDATQAALRANLSEGLAGGESIPELRKRVQQVFAEGYSPLDVRASKVRAEMIARSEIIRASNAGAELGFMQSGVVEGKEWYSALDERVCFPADTLVRCHRNDRPIQDIQIGDMVRSIKLTARQTPIIGDFPVTGIMKREYTEDLYGIQYNGRELIATGDHPVFVQSGKGMTEIKNIAVGDLVESPELIRYRITDTFCVPVSAISSETPFYVYNLEVAGGHTYYANGILVHNCPWCNDMHGKIMGLGQAFFEQGDGFTVDGSTLKLDYEEVRHAPLHPRCVDKETEIYTEHGWKLMKDTHIHESVMTLNPETRNIEWGTIIGKTEHKQDEMVHITNKQNSFDMMVTPEHPFFGYKRVDRGINGRKPEPIWLNGIEELNSEFRFYATSRWIGDDPEFISVGEPELFDTTIQFDVADFCRFMGYYLSEGSTIQRKTGRHQISIHQEIHHEQMWQELKDLPVKKIWKGKDKIYFSDEKLGRYLVQFGKSYQKYVPFEIKQLSAKYIRIFLEAYCLGDGHIKKGKRWKNGNFKDSIVYDTSSKRMADDLGELIIKTGKSVSYKLSDKAGKQMVIKGKTYTLNHDMWRVNELTSEYKMFRNMQVNRVPYNDIVYDVEVDRNHTILTRRNGKVIWGSNCRCTLLPVVIGV